VFYNYSNHAQHYEWYTILSALSIVLTNDVRTFLAKLGKK
jgi:hypothetical protein